MNKNMKYCFLFTIFALLLLAGIGAITAANTTDNQVIKNNEVKTVENNNNIVSTKNNDNLEKINNEVKNTVKTDEKTRNTTSKKEITKTNKTSVKTADTAVSISANPKSALVGDTITISSGSTFMNGDYSVTISLNNTQIASTTAKSSSFKLQSFSFVLPEVAPGDYTLAVRFVKSPFTYAGTTPFTVANVAEDTIIAPVGPVNGKIGSTVIPVTVTYTNGSTLIEDSTLTFKDGNNILLDNVPISNGFAEVNVPTSRLGEYPVTVIFNKNKFYTESTADVTVNVSQASSQIVIEDAATDINVVYNKVISGKLLTMENAPITNAEIVLTFDGVDTTLTTGTEGNFEYNHTVTQLKDNVAYSIKYDGNELYNAASTIDKVVNIKALPITITLDDVALSEVNETTTITGRVIDGLNNPAKNLPINLTISGVNGNIPLQTNENGEFTYDHVFKEAQQVTVTASNNNPLYSSTPATTTFDCIVGPRRTNLTVDVGEGSGQTINIVNVRPYHDVVITGGQLLDIFKEPVANAQITVSINNAAISGITTDNEGKFSIIYNATQGLTTYSISIKFEGNDAYKPAGEQYTGQFKTQALQLSAILDDNLNDEYLIGDNVILTGTATFEDNYYTNSPVVLIIDSARYTTNTDNEGKFSYTYKTTRNGDIPVTATIDNSQATVTNNTLTIHVLKPEVSAELDPIFTAKVMMEKEITGKLYIDSNLTGVKDTVTIIINGAEKEVQTDDDGTFTYTFIPETVGTYNVSLKFDSEKYVTTFEDSDSFEVIKLKTRLENNVLPVAVTIDDTVNFNGVLLDENNDAVTDATVLITVNDETFTTQTDENGIYQYEYTPNAAKDNNIYELRFQGNEIYDLARNYVGSFFDVEDAEAILTADSEIDEENISVYIYGNLKNEHSQNLAGINISITVDSEEFTTLTDENGEYNITYKFDSPGRKVSTISVNDGKHEASTEIEFVIPNYEPDLIIEPVEVDVTEITTLNATFGSSNVNEGLVIFRLNGKTLRYDNGSVIYVPVIGGVATLDYQFDVKQVSNGLTITAVYSGSDEFYSTTSNLPPVTCIIPEPVVSIDNMTAKAGDTIALLATVTLKDEAMNEGNVVFKINGKSLKDSDNNLLSVEVNNGVAQATYVLPEKFKPKEYVLSAVYTGKTYGRAQCDANLTIVDKNANLNSINKFTPTTGKNEAKTIIINQETATTYLTNNGLAASVSAGDTLDFQGTITKGNGLTKILINKPVNIITSTNDGRIDTFTEITFNSGASGSNVTGLYTYNTQFYVKGANHIFFNNITNNVSGAQIGSQVGQTSIREGSSHIIINNSVFHTKDNGGSSTLVFAWCDNSLVENCTIIGEGNVGNIFYLTRYNVNVPSGVIPNTNNTIRNTTIIGPSIPAAISYGIGISGKDILIENCTIHYKGTGITRQSDGGSSSNPTDLQNITVRYNKLYEGCGIGTIPNMFVYNNTIYDNGALTTGNGTYVNNTVYGTITVYSPGGIVENNTANTAELYSNVRLAGNIINGDVNVFQPSSYRASSSNSIIANNTISGSIVVKGYGTSNLAQNNQIIGNNVTGNIALTNSKGTIVQDNRVNGGISLTYSDTNTVQGNEVNGTISMVNTSPYNVITENTVITTNNYAVTVANRLNNITDNYLVSNSYYGNKAVQDTSSGGKAIVLNNGPFATLNVTMDTYSNFFNNEGVFNATLEDNGNVALQGEFTDVVMKFNSGKYNVFGFDENAVLKDSIIIASQNAKLKVSNLTFTISNDNTFNNTVISLESSGNEVINITIVTDDILEDEVMAIDVSANNNSIINSNIEIEANTMESTAINVANSEDIILSGNDITVSGGYAVNVEDSAFVQVSNNYLNTTQGKNDYAVNVDDLSTNVTFELNTPERNVITFIVDDITGVVFDDVTIPVTIVDETDGRLINDGYVTVSVNDELLTDDNGDVLYLEIIDNAVSLDNYPIPSGWLRSDANITFNYPGSGVFSNASVTRDLNIDKLTATVEILSTDLTAGVGDTVTFEAKVFYHDDDVVPSGRIAFKLNDKSLADSEGNLIFVDVVDGIATLDYTIGDNLASGVYELSAVFENPLYYRSEAISTFTIE